MVDYIVGPIVDYLLCGGLVLGVSGFGEVYWQLDSEFSITNKIYHLRNFCFRNLFGIEKKSLENTVGFFDNKFINKI